MTVNRFETLKDTMIPLWKQSFTQAIMIDDQRRAAEWRDLPIEFH